MEAAFCIARHSGAYAAEQWLLGLEEALRSLEELPQRCALAREAWAVSGVKVRQLIYKAHRVLYYIEEDTVHILHLHHGAREALDSSEQDLKRGSD